MTTPNFRVFYSKSYDACFRRFFPCLVLIVCCQKTKQNDRKVSNKHVVIGCTVLPGYIANVATFLLGNCTNTSVSYNPEFIAQGDIIRGLERPDMVLIGEGSPAIGEWLSQMYTEICLNKPEICRMSAASAEICKLSINCFITTKISFANMIGDISDRTPNADKHAILHAVGSDSRIGLKYIKPGYGFGGPCFPRDNRALGQYAKSIGIDPKIPVATDEYNIYHAGVMVGQLLAENRDVYEFDCVTYKEPCAVPIIEESHKLLVAQGLARAGRRVVIKDRKTVVDAVKREYGRIFEYVETSDK
eukprot:TRINITY_DN2929_c0_g1_i2.p1 TRINITY_DN2929_c0_g1~~TRINITY_DN2929_c0_g1_i2.p1  ORF type:complete len:303 (-),score=44.59 TRINITY_DN2929_c0_g1_i2:40-948(-)